MDGQTFRECLRIVEWQTRVLAIGRLSIIDILAARGSPSQSPIQACLRLGDDIKIFVLSMVETATERTLCAGWPASV